MCLPLRQQLQCPFRGARLTNIEKAWNKSRSEVRVSVEILGLQEKLKDMPKCRRQNVYYMCSSAQFPGMFVWLHYFRVFPDVPPPQLSRTTFRDKRTLLKI